MMYHTAFLFSASLKPRSPTPCHRSMDLPQALLDAAAQPVQGAMTGDKLADHFALVHHQLFRLRAALAFATVTGRAIILPPIWCQLDKYWAPLWDGELCCNAMSTNLLTGRF